MQATRLLINGWTCAWHAGHLLPSSSSLYGPRRARSMRKAVWAFRATASVVPPPRGGCWRSAPHCRGGAKPPTPVAVTGGTFEGVDSYQLGPVLRDLLELLSLCLCHRQTAALTWQVRWLVALPSPRGCRGGRVRRCHPVRERRAKGQSALRCAGNGYYETRSPASRCNCRVAMSSGLSIGTRRSPGARLRCAS